MASPATRPTARCATGNRVMAEKPSDERKARWPFDPMQPGDHEPVRLPENLEDLHKQNPAPKKENPRE